jgi:hypothetical protein
MRLIVLCIAAFSAAPALGGELLPTSGVQSPHMQTAIHDHLLPAVIAADQRIKVEPVLESIDIDGRAKRIFWGPLAGGSHVTLRVRIVDESGVTEETFTERRGAWHGAFRPGQDLEMVNSVAAQAAKFVANYGLTSK